jgi:hypothetical protein
MEGLARLVNDSLARHGIEPPLDHSRLQWSKWVRCESSLSFVLVPSRPGLFALAEEIIPAGQVPATSGKRMLAVFQITQSDDLGMALGRMFLPGTPERERMGSGRCFARYAVVEDSRQRSEACNAFQQWLSSSAETASGIGGEMVTSAPFASNASQPAERAEAQTEIDGPAALPSGF